MPHRLRKPLVFIVYQGAEVKLAESIKNLIEAWGYRGFYCRQDNRDAKSYRAELRGKLCRADLVLLLLSREFQWSPYCQAEAGTTMALEKPFIPILVPPATQAEVVNIATVLEGSQFLSAQDNHFVPTLKEAMVRELSTSRFKLKKLLVRLESMATVDLAPPQISNHTIENDCRVRVAHALEHIATQYRLSRPPRILSSVWPNLDDEGCKASIVGNIIHSLRNRHGTTSLAFVGVSLKYSLTLIRRALEDPSLIGLNTAPPVNKKLSIQLVHMDDQSHILHALRDTRDIDYIRLNFGIEWEFIHRKWTELCKAAGIELLPPELCRIDYIPSRVGILIDDDYLFAGRCVFKPVGAGAFPVFHLDVGELEYQFFKGGDRGRNDKAIEEFVGFLKAYRNAKNNTGVAPVWESGEWLDRLSQCLEAYKGTEAVTFISASATKFESMILHLLERMSTTPCPQAKVVVYVHDSGSAGLRKKDLKSRIARNLGRSPSADECAVLSYKHPATFRAIVIGNVMIGLQSYINADGSIPGGTKKIPVGLIFTRCYEHFAQLQQSLVTFAGGGVAAPSP